MIEGDVREHRGTGSRGGQVDRDEDVLPQDPLSLGVTDAVLHEERASEELVGIGRYQRVHAVLALRRVVVVRGEDVETPLRLVGA